MKKRVLFVLFLLLFYISRSFSQDISFKRINYASDNASAILMGITRDPLGYTWFSSLRDGIFRYDGDEFIKYNHNDTNSNTLASDHIGSIYADSSGIIWIGTYGSGLDRFDPASNTFTHFRFDLRDNSSISNDSVTFIMEDRSGDLLVGTCGGFNIYHKKSGKFSRYTFDPKDASSLSYNRIRTIYQDRQGTIWIGCGDPILMSATIYVNGGLNRFNPGKGNFTRFMHDPGNPNSLASNVVGALFEDSKGNFWVGTAGDGLHIMDRSGGTFTHYYYDSLQPEKLSRPPVFTSIDYITFINEDILGGIWIGTLFEGINRYQPELKKISHLGVIRDSTHILKQDTADGYTSFSAVGYLMDHDGMIWITSINKRIYIENLVQEKIPFFPTLKKQGGANSFVLEGDSILWIAADSGLIRKNIKANTERFFGPETKNLNCRLIGPVSIIRRDSEMNVWMGSYAGGLLKFDPGSGMFTRFTHDNNRRSSLSNDSIFSMCMDHDDNIWLGTGNGLDKMNRNTGSFDHIFSGSIVFCIREDQNHELWAGTNNELLRINIQSGKITKMLVNARVMSICADVKNTIWIGADTARNKQQTATQYQSLYYFDRSRNLFVKFNDPVTGNQITSMFDILEDKDQNLWISTTEAIYEMSKNRKEVRHFGEEYGVHRNGFAVGDNYLAGSGKLFFGDAKGYYSFFPGDLKNNSPTRLNFTGLRLNGNEVFPGGRILPEPIWQLKEIRLPHSENSFSIEYVGINYQKTGEMKYQVMLENYDDGWRENNSDKKAFYYNVPPGKYTFHVKAYSSEGSYSEKTIGIIISPPWWKTWWAYTLFVLAGAGAIWSFISYRSRKLKTENRLLEEKVTRRTNQLNQSLEELKATQKQLIQSEKMASLGELTAGIAHEIQNPLNFVNNFSEVNAELITEMKEEIKRGNMEEVILLANSIGENEAKIIHHGKRADSIVKGMLQHSRSSSGQKEPIDLNALVDEYLRLSYHGLRAKDKLINATMETDYDPEMGKVNIIPQDIGRALLNLYNNAFYAVTDKKKQQPEGFEPFIFVQTKKSGNVAEIRIRDNGGGISKVILDKIFQPFFTTKPTGTGTGLGLSLSYDIIKAHGGELIVQSTDGNGAEFIIRIPVT